MADTEMGRIIAIPDDPYHWALQRPKPALYYDFNDKLWAWKANGMVDSLLVNPWPYMSHRHMADILGYDGVRAMAEGWKDSSTDTLKLLCGPHGYTVYKMLVIQWEDRVNGGN